MSHRFPAGFIRPGYDPLKVPNAPTIGTASSSSIAFTAPSNVGGSAITSYVAVATDSSSGAQFNGTGTSSPISVSGLTVGNTYTYRVYAINSYGPSAYSAVSNSTVALPSPGEAYGGGYFAGLFSASQNGVATHMIIVSPKSTGQAYGQQWAAAQSFCDGLTIGGYSDWVLPQKNELEVCYYFLKPTTGANNTSSGANPSAVSPEPLNTNYTSGSPAQTSSALFAGGAQAFVADVHWTNTEYSYPNIWGQYFDSGWQANGVPATGYYYAYTRAIRKVAL